MKKQTKNLMSTQDIPYVVDYMKMMNTLFGEVIQNYFYDLKGKEMFEYNFDRIKADIFALRALNSDALETLCDIAKNTDGNEILSPEEIRECLPDMESFTQESEEIASVVAALEDGMLGGYANAEEYIPALSLLRKKTKMFSEKLSEATRIINNLDVELHFGKYEEENK